MKKSFIRNLIKKEFLKLKPYLIVMVLLFLVPLLTFYLFYRNKILPGIKIANIEVGGLIPERAEFLLEKNLKTPRSIRLIYEDQVFEIPLEDVNYQINLHESVLLAYRRYRTGNIIYDLTNAFSLLKNSEGIGLEFEVDNKKLEEFLSVVRSAIETEEKLPKATFNSGKIIINKGIKGVVIDKKALSAEIIQSLSLISDHQIEIPTKQKGIVLKDDEKERFQKAAETIFAKSIILEYELFQKVISKEEILSFLDYNVSLNKKEVKKTIEYLKEEIESEPQNALFVFREGKVVEFLPAKEGIKIDEENLTRLIKSAFEELLLSDLKEIKINIPLIRTLPKIKTEDVNNLGIKELLGRGVSKFTGSIPSRIHNIGLASSKFNGVLFAPGEIISFNNTLGDVSTYTGYKQAYIIKDNKTILGDGGGVCQVSTTLFRAVIDAGLPIIERRSHSYRVSYYEQDSPPGFDATVYAPTTDLKFKNDTPGYILIQTQFDSKKHTLIFEIYGTNDGRTVTITKPVVTNLTAPPEDLYIDDPNLPLGTIKQIDYKAWGAKVAFNYKVERAEKIIYEKTFLSNYLPWQAKFLRGTAPVQ